MKRLLFLFSFLMIAISSNAQVYSKNNLPGERDLRRYDSLSLKIPVFTTIASLKTNTSISDSSGCIAYCKEDTSFYWSTGHGWIKSGSGGAAQALAAVLAVGNSAGSNGINMNNHAITNGTSYGTVATSFEDSRIRYSGHTQVYFDGSTTYLGDVDISGNGSKVGIDDVHKATTVSSDSLGLRKVSGGATYFLKPNTDVSGTPTFYMPKGIHNQDTFATVGQIFSSAGGDLTGTYPNPTLLRQLTPTTVKTANYTASVNDFVPCDNTSASFTVILPTAPADKSIVGVKMVIQGGTNTITIQCGGSDVINKAGGSTTLSLALLNEGKILQYKASTGIWYAISDNSPRTIVTPGTGTTVTGNGTSGNPYVVSATGGSTTTFPDSISVGTALPKLGLLKNTGFPGPSIPANHTKSGTFTTTYNSGLTWSGSDTTWTHYIEDDSAYYNFDKEEYYGYVVIQNKSASTYGFGITFGSNDLFYSQSLRCQFRLSADADSGRVIINGFKSGNLSFIVGDTLNYKLKRKGWNITGTLYNRRTRLFSKKEINTSNGFGTGGRVQLHCLQSSAMYIGQWACKSDNIINPEISFVGSSHTAGAGSTNELYSFVAQAMNGNLYRTCNFGATGITIAFQYNSYVANVVALHPRYLVLEQFYNNESQSALCTDTLSTGAMAIYLNKWDSVCNVNGIIPIYLPLMPRKANAATNCFSTFTQNFSIAKGRKWIDTRTPLLNGSAIDKQYLCSGDIHLSNAGHIKEGAILNQFLTDSCYLQFNKDSSSFFNANNLPTTTLPMPSVVVDKNGGLWQSSIPVPNAEVDYVKNLGMQQTDGSWSTTGMAVQSGALGMTGLLKTETGVMLGGTQANILFNDATRTSLYIGNGGVNAIGNPSAIDALTGAGVLVINPLQSKTGGSSTVSGLGNGFIQTPIPNASTISGTYNKCWGCNSMTITTGAGNLGWGKDALKNITTQNNSISITNQVDYNGGPAPSITVDGTVQIGNGMGDFNGTKSLVVGQVNIAGFTRGARSYVFGPMGGLMTSNTWSFGVQWGTNQAAVFNKIATTPPTGNGATGTLLVTNYTPGSSGVTESTTEDTSAVFRGAQVNIKYGAVIGNATTTIPGSAALYVQSTTKGALISPMTTAQRVAISSPAAGLLVYDTDLISYMFYNGTSWRSMNTSFSGSYTPTGTNGTNITANTPAFTTYSRTANVVTVYGSVSVTATVGISSDIALSLPIASNLTAVTDLNGTMTATGLISSGYIIGDATNDVASLRFTPGAGGTQTLYYSFQYTVQ